MIRILASIGVFLSVYVLYIRWQRSRSLWYKPMCDLSAKVSCTQAFESEYSSLLGVDNSILGLLFYALVFMIADTQYVFWLAVLGVLASCFLAYISFFKQKNLCVVCLAVYVVNGLLMVYSW